MNIINEYSDRKLSYLYVLKKRVLLLLRGFKSNSLLTQSYLT